MTSLSQPLQAVLALFEGPLSGVRFADIDASGLTKLAAEVASAAAEVELQEAKLGALRQGLAQRQEALLGLAQQALAYARVYAEHDEALLATLNDIALPRATKPRKAVAPKPRGAGEGESVQAAEQPSEGEAPSQLTVSDDVGAPDEVDEAPLSSVPSKAGRPKVKRRLGRAAPQGDSV